MSYLDMTTSFIRIEHWCSSTRDPVIEFYLKQICRKNNWEYNFCNINDFFCEYNDLKVMVVDLFAHPIFYSSIVEELKCFKMHSNLSFLFILPRVSLTAFAPSFFFQSEYCFLGFDGVEEILQRIRIILSRKNFALGVSLPYPAKSKNEHFEL